MPDLDSFINEFVQVFDGWSSSIEQKAKIFGQNRNEFLKQAQDSIKDLNEKEKQIKEQITKITLEQQKENDEINKLSESLSSLQIFENKLPNELQTSQKEHEELNLKYESIMKELEEEYTKLSQKLITINNTISIYNNRLGLCFTCIPNYIKCIFTKIDKNNEDKEFSFLLSLSDNNEYTISQCSPSLPGDKINRILLQVNKTNQLCKLMKEMRIIFKETL